MSLILLIISYLIAYLIGAIPFSFMISKFFYGIDIRKMGSGNVGATNVIRFCGKKAGAWAYFLDISKGIVAAYVLSLFSQVFFLDREIQSWIILTAYFFPIIGHMYPVFLRFKGGKGVAVSVGIFLYLLPIATLSAIIIFLFLFFITKIISLCSIVAAFLFPFFVYFYQKNKLGFVLDYQSFLEKNSNFLFLVSIIIACFIIVKHRGNIKRLLKGKEYSFKNNNNL